MSEDTLGSLSWRAHPARTRPGPAVAAGLVIVGLSLAAYAMFGHPASAPIAAIVLVASLNRFFFPSRFVIDEEGITARYPLRRLHLKWTEVRRLVLDKHGGYLSTRTRPSWLDAYRGMHLIFNEQRDAIVRRIRSLMAHEGAA